MNKKERRVRFLLELFFLAAGLYVLLMKAAGIFEGVDPGELFESRRGVIPVFNLAAYSVTGLACIIASWALWRRASWAAGWCMFTFGMLLYGNLQSIGAQITDNPAQTIPMIIIVLVVMQSFPFLINGDRRRP